MPPARPSFCATSGWPGFCTNWCRYCRGSGCEGWPVGRCPLTGHPIDVATGRLLTRAEEFTLRGPIPMVFERFYSSSWAERPSPVGYGWSHTLDERIWLERGKVVYKAGDGRGIDFHTFHLPERRMRVGDEIFYPIDKLTLKCLGDGNWTITGSDGITRHFALLPGDRTASYLVEIRNRSARWVRFVYDNDRVLERVETSEGRAVRLEHERGVLRRLMVQNPDGEGWYEQARYEYSAEGDLVRAVDSLGAAREYRYEEHLMIQEVDRDKVSFWFEYDGRDSTASCVRTWGSDGKGNDRLFFRELTYDKQGNKTYVEDSAGKTTVYRMNVANAVVAITDPHGATIKTEYNDYLWKTSETNALGQTETYRYDARGNEVQRTLRNGTTVSIEYDEHNHRCAWSTPWGSNGSGTMTATGAWCGALRARAERTRFRSTTKGPIRRGSRVPMATSFKPSSMSRAICGRLPIPMA